MKRLNKSRTRNKAAVCSTQSTSAVKVGGFITLVTVAVCFSIYFLNDAYNELITRKRMIEFIKHTLIKLDINNQSKMLDFGGGNCLISKHFKNLNVHTIDIIDNTKCSQYSKYDGWSIPYPDKYFDITICMYVLHHIPHQDCIIKELNRVSKYCIIIEDDYSEKMNTISKTICKLHYKKFNQPTTNTKYMKNKQQWEDYLLKNEFSIIESYDIPGVLSYPVPHIGFLCKCN